MLPVRPKNRLFFAPRALCDIIYSMKRKIYVGLFILLGLLLQFIVHSAIEVAYISLLIKNFDVYGFGLSWNAWFLIHHLFSTLLIIGGLLFGWQQGEYWYQRVYGSYKN